jgi:uncharacterized lipoprotein
VKFAPIAVVFLVFVLAACGGPEKLKCDNEGAYLAASPAPKVRAPEGMDELETYREVPVPEASPQAERAADGRCLEAPPPVTIR